MEDNIQSPSQQSSPLPTKPTPAPVEPEVLLPKCPLCFQKVEKIRWMDYEQIRIVFHDTLEACVLGVMKAE